MRSTLMLGAVICAIFMVEQGLGAVTATPGPSTTPKSIEQQCRELTNQSCDVCLKNPKCMYCHSNKACLPYPVGNILPIHTCKGGLSDARWGVCWVNFQVLLIVMGTLGGVILLSLCCCVYCCCCRSGSRQKKKYQQEDAKFERQKEERKAKSDERRADRMKKHDEIRRKYGIGTKGLNQPASDYTKLSNDDS